MVGETPVCMWSVPRICPDCWHSGRCPHPRGVVLGPTNVLICSPSFPCEDPIPQELAEAEGHNPLATRKADLLLKTQQGVTDSGAFILLKGKRNLPRLRGAEAGEHAGHGSAFLGQHQSSVLQGHSSTGTALGRAQVQAVPQLFKQAKKMWKRTQASPRFPSKCCTGATRVCSKQSGHS